MITFHHSYNCGSMLQSYALQTVIEKMGISCEIVNFSNAGQGRVYSVLAKDSDLKSIVKNMLLFPHRDRIQANFDGYEAFMNKYLNLSGAVIHEASSLTDEGYDILVAGSDQVWNITIEDGDDAYFLSWVKQAKKVAYAPSFGAKNPLRYARDSGFYSDILADFDHLSIREGNGRKWIAEMTSRDVPVLLDPTLLLDQVEYLALEEEIALPGRYIFYYGPSYDRKNNTLIREISRKYKLPVVAFNAKSYFVKGMQFSKFLLPQTENPRVFLSLIKNASLVITTSFHGSLFSSIYRRPFWTIKQGGMVRDDDRVATFMSQLCLEDRMVPQKFDQSFDYRAPVDYEPYEQSLRELKIASQGYLERALLEQ